VSGEPAAALETSSARDAAWGELRLMSATLRRLLYACVPVFALAYVLGLVLLQPWLYPLAMIAWLAAIGWAGARMARFACPRCGGAFFETWYFFKPLRRACAGCGLPREAK
jgi:hypothetical protein